jgi:hypothetical protein
VCYSFIEPEEEAYTNPCFHRFCLKVRTSDATAGASVSRRDQRPLQHTAAATFAFNSINRLPTSHPTNGTPSNNL